MVASIYIQIKWLHLYIRTQNFIQMIKFLLDLQQNINSNFYMYIFKIILISVLLPVCCI